MLATVLAGAALVLSGGTVIDGYGNAPIPDGIVVIDGDRILAVGGAGQVAIPEGAEIVSTEGMTVLPGLWDMQVDLMRLGHADARRWNETYGPLAERVVMPIAARQLLAAGVTSARDVAAPIEAAIRVRGRVRERIIEGPGLYVSGPALRKLAPVGTSAWQWEVESADDAREKVQRLASEGVDYLLLADLGMWTAEELAAAVSEARIRGLPVHAYAEKPEDVVRGAAAQLDGFLGAIPGAGPYPAEMMQAITGRLTQAGARPLAWTPAISAPLNLEWLRQNDEPLDDPRATEQLPPLVAADVRGSLAGLSSALPEPPAAPALCEKLRQLDEAKVLLLVGSGAGEPGHLHSRATWQEIDFWVRDCGLPAVRAIRAATHDAATAMGVGHELGAISPGKIADVIAVRGDVLRNPALLQSVDVVIKGGRR
ncbi:MAG TPA: amidohydrolase family protein, partial [Steroidobacteraceae bacterium]|nr:amidohydrolase family protein [Steroidobacteraceae bacterium]